jgi:phage baseplate assembly protein W
VSIELSNVALQINFAAAGADEVIQNVKTIITTPAGTVPFDRDFGIDWSILDLPIQDAKARLTVEYIEKIKKYEPRASIKSVSFVVNEQGQLIPKVVIDIVST